MFRGSTCKRDGKVESKSLRFALGRGASNPQAARALRSSKFAGKKMQRGDPHSVYDSNRTDEHTYSVQHVALVRWENIQTTGERGQQVNTQHQERGRDVPHRVAGRGQHVDAQH